MLSFECTLSLASPKMAHPISSSPLAHIDTVIFQALAILLLFLVPHAKSISFSFDKFYPNMPNILFENDSFAASGVIQLTRNQQVSSLGASVGRASYSLPVPLWDRSTKRVTDFTTHFSFIIKSEDSSSYGDGLTFFLAPFDSSVPNNSTGAYLGLVTLTPQSFNVTSKNQFVAVEFDTFPNPWDPASDHIGIDVNSVVSVADVVWNTSMKNGSVANAWITYDSSTKNLSVFLTYADYPTFNRNSSLWHIVDLSSVLPDKVRVGFSASTNRSAEIHNILSWEFNSTLEDTDNTAATVVNNRPRAQISYTRRGKSKRTGRLVGGIVAGIGAIAVGLGSLLSFMCGSRSSDERNEESDSDVDSHGDSEQGTGPILQSAR